jgi:very-short-patch-repair endonuclease
MVILPVPEGLPALFAAQHGLASVTQARAFGLNHRMVRRREELGELDRPSSGVIRLLAAPCSWEQQAMLAILASRGDAVASHRTAAALHGLDGCVPGPIEVSVVRPRRLRLSDVTVHQVADLDQRDVLRVRGIPCTGLARTLCDLGSVVAPDAVERAFDDARRRGVSLRWLEITATRLHGPGQRGTGVLLRVLADARRAPTVRGSWFEKLVEDCLQSSELPPLVRQHEVHDDDGRLVGILDLAFPSIRLGVEAHSRQFHFGRAAEHRDEDRDHRLASCGWEMLYVGWQGTRHPDELLAVVVAAARHRVR